MLLGAWDLTNNFSTKKLALRNYIFIVEQRKSKIMKEKKISFKSSTQALKVSQITFKEKIAANHLLSTTKIKK